MKEKGFNKKKKNSISDIIKSKTDKISADNEDTVLANEENANNTKKKDTTKEKCNHEYRFLPHRINGTLSRIVRGVCIRCGSNLELSYSEYGKLLQKQQNETE